MKSYWSALAVRVATVSCGHWAFAPFGVGVVSFRGVGLGVVILF